MDKSHDAHDAVILIIGAGPNQVPAIRLARSLGVRVAVTDLNPNAEGFAQADYHGVVSTRDVEGTVQFARDLRRSVRLTGVMTMASESGYTVARVAAALGLPGVNPAAAWRAMHKVERQQAFQRRGVPAPRFCTATNAYEAINGAATLGWPVVVKPVDGAGARGVRKVNGPDEMTDAVAEVRAHSRHSEILIEEFLTGTEHSIEGIVVEGQVFWTGFSDRNYDKKESYPPYFLEDGDTLPTSLTAHMQDSVIYAAEAAVRALGINWGPVKGDILVDAAGPKVLEMAARLSGDYFCWETVPLHNGTDLLRAVMLQSLGWSVERSLVTPRYQRGVALRYVWPRPGRVVDIVGLDDARATPGVHFVRWEPKWRDLQPGTIIAPPRSHGERVASVLVSGETRAEAVSWAEAAVGKIRIVTEEIS